MQRLVGTKRRLLYRWREVVVLLALGVLLFTSFSRLPNLDVHNGARDENSSQQPLQQDGNSTINTTAAANTATSIRKQYKGPSAPAHPINGFSLQPPDFVPLPDSSNAKILYADAEGSAKRLLKEAQTPRAIPDDVINAAIEAERCKRYGLTYSGRMQRRRVFYGGNIADDSWHIIGLTALENYGVFHTVVFSESK